MIYQYRYFWAVRNPESSDSTMSHKFFDMILGSDEVQQRFMDSVRTKYGSDLVGFTREYLCSYSVKDLFVIQNLLNPEVSSNET